MPTPNQKMIFIIPPSPSLKLEFVTYQEPINLAYLASSVIGAGFSAAIWDYGIEEFNEKDFIKNVRESHPLAIGIHCKTFNITRGHHIAGIIKKHCPSIPVIIGGPHSSALPVETLEEFPFFDMVVVGEGESTIVELCRALSAGSDLKNVHGLTLRADDKIYRTGKRELIGHLDHINYPARHLLKKEAYEKRHSTRGISPLNFRSTEIFTSRGCPGECTFCAANVSYGNCVRFRTAGNVLGEIEDCVSRYKYNHLIIQDDTFTLNESRVSEILSGFERLKIKSWSCDSRVDMVNEAMLRRMADTGCKKISFGIESGSEKILKLIKKNITLDQIVKAVALAKASKIEVVECTFIVGSHPDETFQDVDATRRLIKELRPDIIAVSVIVPYPGTEVYNLMNDRGYIKAKKWDDFQIIGATPAWRTANFSPADMMSFQRKLINDYYMSPGYVLRSIGKIKNIREARYFLSTGLQYAKFVMKNKIRR